MTDNSKARGRAAAAIRAALLDPAIYAGPREPARPATRTQRLVGAEFHGWDAREDARAVLRPLLDIAVPEALRRAIERAVDAPKPSRLRRLEPVLRSLCDDGFACRPEIDSYQVLSAANAIPYQLAALGDRVASARISADSLNLAWTCLLGGDYARGWLALRAGLLWANDAQADVEPGLYVPGPLFSRLSAFDANAAVLLAAFQTIAEAEAGIEVEEDLLRGGVSARSEAPPTSLAEILRHGTALRSAAELTHVVCASDLHHLPEPTKSAADRGDSPRALAGPIAQKALSLTPVPDLQAYVASLRARFPWAEEEIDAYAQDLVGARYASFRPRILVSPPGFGKTAFARALFEAAGLDVTLYSASGQIDGGAFAGTGRTWSTWRLSVPAQACLRLGKASHGIIVDEAEKGGDSRRWGRLDEALLPFLERGSTARAVFDPALECPLDLSPVSYVLTVNGLDGVGGPLRDRCQVLRWPAPRRQDLPVVASAILDELRRDRALDETWCPPLDGEELDALTAWRGGSLRPLRRMVEAVLSARETLARRSPN